MITVAIQAGGRSSRMGRDKGLVMLHGQTMVEHVLQRISGLGDEILLTTNAPDDYAFLGLRMASDERPGAGALPGLKTALQAAQGELVLLVACDMPFLNRPLLAHMLDSAANAAVEVVVPYWNEQYQTMHAVYRRDACLAAVNEALAQGQKRMISFYPAVRVHTIGPDVISRFDPAGRTFFNVNTPEELEQAEMIIAGSL